MGCRVREAAALLAVSARKVAHVDAPEGASRPERGLSTAQRSWHSVAEDMGLGP